MRLRDSSFAIGIGSMAPSSHADCAPWASGTSLPHQPRLGRMALPDRLIGSIRRECLDHIIVFGEAHLRRIPRSYARYYNDIRTHRSLDKDAPAVRPVQRTGILSSHPILGGLHHGYVRV